MTVGSCGLDSLEDEWYPGGNVAPFEMADANTC